MPGLLTVNLGRVEDYGLLPYDMGLSITVTEEQARWILKRLQDRLGVEADLDVSGGYMRRKRD